MEETFPDYELNLSFGTTLVICKLLLPPQGFRPEAKARGGIHCSLRVYIENVLTVKIYGMYTRKNLDLLEKGREECRVMMTFCRKASLGNDDV